MSIHSEAELLRFEPPRFFPGLSRASRTSQRRFIGSRPLTTTLPLSPASIA
jgi:hypothetical protein